MPRLLLLLLLLPAASAFAQFDDGRLYNPPGLEMRARLTRDLGGGGSRHDEGDPNRSSSTTITIRRQEYYMSQPLLPAIFFDVASARFPSRYRFIRTPAISGGYVDTMPIPVKVSETTFGEGLSMNENISKYYELLDIVGYRMRRYPDAHLTLEGGYSSEPGEEAALATGRAEAVQDHLVTMWGINPDRIELLDPVKGCSAEALPMEQEEARHVFLFSNEPRLLEPVRFGLVLTEDLLLYFDFAITPRFAAGDIRDMEMSVAIGDALIYRSSLPVNPDSTSYRFHGVVPIIWLLDDPIGLREEVTGQVVITLNDGRKFLSNQTKLAFAEERQIAESHDDEGSKYEFELPYFGWRDTVPGKLQAPMLAQAVNNIVRTLSDSAREERARLDSIYKLAEMAIDSSAKESDTEWSKPEEYVPEPDHSEYESTEAESLEPESMEPAPEALDTTSVPALPVGVDTAVAAEVDTAVLVDPEEMIPHVHVDSVARVHISATTDFIEASDIDISPYLSLRGRNFRREIGQMIVKPLIDRANPPRMIIVGEEELDNDAVQMAWFGFNIDEVEEEQRAARRKYEAQIEGEDSVFFDESNPRYQSMIEREQRIVAGRVRTTRDLLLRAGLADTSRVHLRLDTNDYDYSERGGAFNQRREQELYRYMSPEQRLAGRVVVLTLRLDPEWITTPADEGEMRTYSRKKEEVIPAAAPAAPDPNMVNE